MLILKCNFLFISILLWIGGFAQNDTINFSGKKYVGYENEIKSFYPFRSGTIDFINNNKALIKPSSYCYDCHIMCEGCTYRYCYPSQIYQDTPTYHYTKDTLWLTSTINPDFLSKQKLKINTCYWTYGLFANSVGGLWGKSVASINAQLKKEKDSVIVQLEFDSLLFLNSINSKVQLFVNDKLYKSDIPKIKGEYKIYGNFIQNLKDTIRIKMSYSTFIADVNLTIEENFTLKVHDTKTLDLSISFDKVIKPCPIKYLIFKNDELAHDKFTYRKKLVFR